MKLIAGPCAIEGNDWLVDVAEKLVEQLNTVAYPLDDFYFKASFDKANRTSDSSLRGTGIDDGLPALARVKDTHGVKILTDFHECWQIEKMMVEYPSTVDVIQIPAFLCRQTDLIQAACETGKIVNIKKGQWLSPHAAVGLFNKAIQYTTEDKIWITERGCTHGYSSLLVDIPGLVHMYERGCNVIFDGTHSAQAPGGGSTTDGDREKIVPNTRAAISTGILHGLFFETHPDPYHAISDRDTQIRLDHFGDFLQSIGYDPAWKYAFKWS